MKEKKILVLLPVTEEDKEYLVSRASGAAQPCRFVFSSLEEAAEEDIASSQIIIGRFPVDKVKTATSLEWLQVPMAGTDAYVVPGAMMVPVHMVWLSPSICWLHLWRLYDASRNMRAGRRSAAGSQWAISPP